MKKFNNHNQQLPMTRTYGFLFILLLAVFPSIIGANSSSMLLRLQANGNSMQNETVVYFEAGATYNYNTLYDAPSLGVNPGFLNIVTQVNGVDFQVKGFPSLTQSISVPVKVVTGTSGMYEIYTDGMQNLPEGACVFLYDSYAQVNWDLRTGSYECTISDTEQVARFTLNIITSVLNTNGQSVDPTCLSSADGMIIATGTGSGPWNYYWKDSLNNIIKTTYNSTTADTLNFANGGFYRVDVNTSGTCDNGALYFTLQGNLSPKAYFTSDTVTGTFQNTAFTNTSQLADTYWWDFGDGMGGDDTNATHKYSTAGTYTVFLTAYSSLCNETSVFTKEILVSGSLDITSTVKATDNTEITRDMQGYFVKFNFNAPTPATLYITDLSGRIVHFMPEQKWQDEKQYLDLSGFENKVLIISVLSGKQNVSRKVLVQY